MARQPTAAVAVLGALIAVALSADGIHGQLAQQNAGAAERLAQSSDTNGEPDLLRLSPSDDRTPTIAAAGPSDSQGSALPIPDSARLQTLYTTFTFINRFVKDDRPVAITTRETISRLTSLVPGQVAPSGTTRRTKTFFTTYTYYKTESASEGGRPRITSTEEVTTQVVVTEAARLPAVVPRPAAVLPVVLATVPPQQPPQAPLLVPTVEPSLSTDGTGVRNSVVMAATRTFYTTSTFYTTLVESGSTVVRSRTELTSRMQTELTTTWLQLAPSAVRPFVSKTVTWLGQSGQQQQEKQQQQAPVRQAAVAGAEADGEKNSQSSAQSTEGNDQASESATEGASEEDKNAVLLAIQTLVAEADKENMGADQAASAPAALIPDTIISAPGSGAESAQMAAESTSSALSSAGVQAPEVVPESAAKPISKKPLVTKVTSEVKPLASKVKSTTKPTKAQTPSSSKPVKPQTQTSSKPTKPQAPNPSKPTKPQAAPPSEPVKAQTANKPVKPQAPTPSQFLVAPAPVAAPSPPTSTIQTSVQTSTSTSVSESSALSPGLGGLAGGLLGLGGLAAGLIRNVLPLPLPLRRDGSSGVPPGGSPFQRPRPGGRPGIRPGPRPIRPGLRPQGGNRRHQTLANRNDNGYLVVVGPGGQRIQLNRAPESGHTPPTRRTGHLAGVPLRSGAPGGVQAPPSPQRRPGFHSGAPVRRVDRPRRPQTGSRPLTRIPSRIDGPPPRRGARPGRPGRPLGRPHGRPVGLNHLHRPGRPVSRRPRPHPTGYIAVRPGDPTPPSDFQRQPTQFRQPVHGDTARPEQHRHTGPVHRPQSDVAAHAAPSHPQHGAVRPPPHHAGPGKNQSPQHGGDSRQSHRQHATNVRPTTSNHVGVARPPPAQHTGAARPPPVRQHVASMRPPIRQPQGSVRPQLPQHPKPIRRPPPSHAQANDIHGNLGSLQNRPPPTDPVVSHPSSIDVLASGNTVPHSDPETLYREHFVKAPKLQTDALVFKSEIEGSPHPVPGNTRVTSQLPSYYELNSGVDQEPSDDQKSSASVFTNIGPDGEVQRNPEDIVRVVTAPAYAGGQEAPAVQATPILVPTLHTIASVEGPNRIVGTNVFKQVGPLSTLEALELVTDNVPAPLQPSQVATNIQATQTVREPSPFAGTRVDGTEPPSLSSGPVNVVGTDPTPEGVEKEHSLKGSFTGHNGESDTGSDGPQSQGFGSHVSETTRPHLGQKIPTPDGTATTPIFPKGVSNSDNSRPFFGNTDEFGSSATQEEPVYPDGAEDQYASSTNDDSVGNDRESDYNALASANAVPSAPSLPGLAGIGFEQLPVTVSPTVKTESPDQANALEENVQFASPQYEDEEGLNPTIGYDYSVPQYDPALENSSSDQYPESGDDAKPFGPATLDQSNDSDGYLTTNSAQDPEVLPSPGEAVPTANNEDGSNIDSFNDGNVLSASSGHDKEGGVSAWISRHGDDADDFGGNVERGTKPLDSTWASSPAGNTGAGQSASSEGATVDTQVNSQWTDQGQGDRDVTLPPSDETAPSLWNPSPVGESEDNSENVQREDGLHATPTSPYEPFGERDDSSWNKGERPTSSESIWSDRQPGNSDDYSREREQAEEVLNDPVSANGQPTENKSSVPTNAHTDLQNVALGSTQQSDNEESAFGRQQEANGGKTSSSNSEYETQGSSQSSGSSSNLETSPVPNGPFTAEETEQSPLSTHSIQEQDSATEKTSTSALVNDENDREESVPRPTRKPFRGIVRPSASRKPFRGTARPPVTRRPFRKTVRPSVTRKPFRGPVRPSVTRPFRGTRRPTSTRKPFRGIERPDWAQFHENDRDRQNGPVSATEVSQGIETDGHAEDNKWDYDLNQEQPYDETANAETGDSQSETGVLTSAEGSTKDSVAHDTDLPEHNQDLLSHAQQQEHDLDLDPSIKEEWVQTSDDSDSTEGIQGRPGINLASSTGQESSDIETSDTQTPGLNTSRLPGRRKPSQRPSLADIIRQTLLASRSSSTLVTVDISSSSSLIRISSSAIAPSRTRIPPGIATSRSVDRERVPPGIVRPVLEQGRDEQTGGLAWPSDNDYGTGNSVPTGEQETDTGGSSWDYGQTGSSESSDGISYGEDYGTGASGPGFGQEYETGTSSPAYYPDYYETGTSTSTEGGTAQDAKSEWSGDQATVTDNTTEQIVDQNAEEGGKSSVKQSTSTNGQEVEGQQDRTVEVENVQPVSTTQDPIQLAGLVPDDESQAPKSNVDVTLSISTSETSQEVSVQHSVSETSAPTDAVSEDDPESESPLEVVVGVSTTGGLIADVSEVTTTEKPMPTTENPVAPSATQKETTENGRLPSEDGDNASPATPGDAPTPAPAAPSTGDPGPHPSGGAPGRGSVAIAGLLIPTQQKGELNRGVETPGLEQPLLSEDKGQEDKCPRPCQAAINEVCRQMDGEYLCLCRPGFSRARDSDACETALTYQVRLLLDRVNDIPLQYRPPFGEPSSPEYRQLAGLAAGGLRENLATGGPLASRLHAATLMEFKRAADLPGTAPNRPQALMADVMVQITDRESKSFDKDSLQQIVEDSLRRTNYSLSDRQVMVSPLHGDVTVIDFDECQSPDYNDCHEQAFCFNLAGSFTCSCRDGLVDTGVPSLPGRSCTGEYSGCPECSYSGECYTEESGEAACRCHRWYAGQRCQVNLRVLLIALASAGALLTTLLCVCCYFCCRRRGRRMAAPPLVFSGPGGLWRHRGSRLHQPVADQRAMLDSSSDTSIPVSNRRRPPSGGRRLLPPLSGGQKPSGPGGRGSQQQPPAPDGQRPSRFLPRPRHKPDASSGPRSLSSQAGGDPSAAPGRTQPQLMGLLHPADGGRGRTSGGTFRAGRSSRSSARLEGEPQVSHLPGGRSRSSSGGRRPEPEVSQQPAGRSRSHSSDSLSGPPERMECGTHSFFRARTMSDARSFDEELIEPSVRPVARFDTTRSQRSSHAPSSHGYTYEHHTMAERDAASTYVMPETHLFRRAQDSDAQSETSLVEDFPRMDAASTVSSRRGFR